jgi:hypothetical protein
MMKAGNIIVRTKRKLDMVRMDDELRDKGYVRIGKFKRLWLNLSYNWKGVYRKEQ